MATSCAAPAADKIKSMFPADFAPKIAIIMGSGCGGIAAAIESPTTVSYGDLPGFPVSTVQGHAGNLLLGKLNGIPIIGLQGRVHYYEGNPRAMMIPVYAMKLVGCENLLLTSAVGSLRRDCGPGSLVCITDHINLQGVNPLVGPNDPIGPRFPDMQNAYDSGLRKALMETSQAENLAVAEGVYCATSGPSFETPSEIRAFRTLGADVVGMSTVPEVILARHSGLKVACLSIVVNLAAGMDGAVISHDETLHYTKQAAERVETLLKGWIKKI